MTTRALRPVAYASGDKQFEGKLAVAESDDGPRPGVLVAHTIRGRTEFEESKAEALVDLGYTAMAADVYGVDEIGGSPEQSRANMEALKDDRQELHSRLIAALEALAAQPEVDESRLAAIGYCFGGLCVFDLARLAAPVAGVAGFHGLFDAPDCATPEASDVKVLALHGWDDPLATPDDVTAFAAEMTARGIDWQCHAYGHTMHAFTYPPAADSERGTVYHPAADRRSWAAMTDFLAELFG